MQLLTATLGLAPLDWLVIGLYLVLTLGLGLYYTKRGGESLSEYFLSGRTMPWWLAGLSMVATTFAADTPLAVTELVRNNGISGNWLWWNMLLGSMLTTFFFARYWRRSGIMTDLELISIRYSGAASRFLRSFKAVYMGLLLNALVIGWVNLAMVAILEGFFGLSRGEALLYTGGCMLFTTLYVTLAGLRGVMITDAAQFVLAMAGCIVLAFLVINSEQVGGLSGLVEKVPAASLQFFPSFGSGQVGTTLALGVGSFLAYAAFQWWASWYPGAEPGGGGYIAQRILSAKDERNGLASSLLFNVMHYAVRPWPWVLVGLGSLILYPELADAKQGYILAMRDFLPTGLKGLLLAGFFAAYMSTLSTQLNWGASYLINDFYKRYREGRTEAHYIGISRITTVAIMLLSFAITTQLTSIAKAWEFLLNGSAGMGLVLILRWYWWRVSAWAELIATAAPLVIYGVLMALGYDAFPMGFFITIGCTTVAWLLATYLLPGTDPAVLQAFYNKVQPQGAWGPFSSAGIKSKTPFWALWACWLFGIALVYGMLFSVGKFLFLQPADGFVWLGVAAVSTAGLVVLGRRYPIFS